MYNKATTQEVQHKDFFYPKETMGTTIMAVKYDRGVIAVADSSNPHLIQELQQEESTSLIE
jgi:20S proteasome alpha/beta subunit